MSTRIKRKPGGHPGPVLSLSNGNQACPERSRRDACKHGSPRLGTGALIHKSLTPQQQSILPGAAAIHGLDREVTVLRVKTCPEHSRRIASILKNDPQNLDVLSQAISTLGRTLRNRQSLVNAKRRFVSWLKAENDSSLKRLLPRLVVSRFFR
jgi:hypothetical protein